MSSDLSAEITAIATAALTGLAIVTTVVAFLAYRKQSQEVRILRKQNEREANDRRRAQAARVFTGSREIPASGAVVDTTLTLQDPAGVHGSGSPPAPSTSMTHLQRTSERIAMRPCNFRSSQIQALAGAVGLRQ